MINTTWKEKPLKWWDWIKKKICNLGNKKYTNKYTNLGQPTKQVAHIMWLG
jgi:hypothetical protein